MNLAALLVIPFEVPSQNSTERRHWSGRAKERKELGWRVTAALPAGGCPHLGRKRFVEIVAYRAAWIRDAANLVGGSKTLLDALVAVGVLRDDSTKWVEVSYDQGLYRRAGYDQPTTVIRIYDLAEET
ncbi:MAG TPA: hypothetical protein VEL07_19370 [Planctomycetota bacterium]|nr:hypothetical protein [Planctomycetota bacterium]